MSTGFYTIPDIRNEPVKTYAPGTPERAALKNMLTELRSKELDVPMIIGGKEIRTDKKVRMFPPHDIKHTLGYYYQGDGSHVQMAIDAALSAREQWAALS
jgi:1-pyrroline-5-carboxylate dehydrogenase